jgi:hypothetical protein
MRFKDEIAIVIERYDRVHAGNVWQRVLSNDAGLLQELFEQTVAVAQQLRLRHRFSLFICVTLTCSACFASSLGVAHQTSLRSRSTMMRHANSLSGGG